MVLIVWKQEYAVGVAEVDYEHRQLIGLINQLASMLERQDGDLGVEQFLGEIYAKISAHFALEEKIMRERSYDQYEDHKADHERLLDEIRDIMDEYEDKRCFDRKMLAERLSAWFGVHFRTKDARLHRHLPH
jgi:hemerythrin-like metal-binding protein